MRTDKKGHSPHTSSRRALAKANEAIKATGRVRTRASATLGRTLVSRIRALNYTNSTRIVRTIKSTMEMLRITMEILVTSIKRSRQAMAIRTVGASRFYGLMPLFICFISSDFTILLWFYSPESCLIGTRFTGI